MVGQGNDKEVGFIWFLAGLGLGMFLGVLYAPRSGSETRQGIKETVEEGREYIQGLRRDVRDSAVELVERGKDTLREQRQQLASAIEVGREAYRDATAENTYTQNNGGHE